jgi:hypothetical protein
VIGEGGDSDDSDSDDDDDDSDHDDDDHDDDNDQIKEDEDRGQEMLIAAGVLLDKSIKECNGNIAALKRLLLGLWLGFYISFFSIMIVD